MSEQPTAAFHLPKEALLYAYDMHADGTASALSHPQTDTNVPADVAYRWIHLDLAVGEISRWITQETDDVIADSLTREDTRPRSTQHMNGFLVNLRGVNLNPDSEHEDMVSIRLWISSRLILSVRFRKLMAVVAIREQVEAGKAPPDPAAFLSLLSTGLTVRMDPVISDLSDAVDALETRSIDGDGVTRADLARMRRKAILLRRYISPQREALNGLAFTPNDMLDAADMAHFRENADRVLRMVEELDAVRERCTILNDQLSDSRAEQMNDRLMILSVITAIFLPLGFLTGLFGVNVGGLPGTENPSAFWMFAGAQLALGLLLLWWFRHRKWF